MCFPIASLGSDVVTGYIVRVSETVNHRLKNREGRRLSGVVAFLEVCLPIRFVTFGYARHFLQVCITFLVGGQSIIAVMTNT